MGAPNPLGSKKFDIPTVNTRCRSPPRGALSCMHAKGTQYSLLCMQVKPYLSYVLLFLNLAVYGGGIAIALTQSNDASNEWFLSLAKVNDRVAGGEFYRCMPTSVFLLPAGHAASSPHAMPRHAMMRMKSQV